MWQTEAKAVREAVRLAIPEGTAKSRLCSALRSLADRLAAEGILER